MIRMARRWLVWQCLDERKPVPPWLMNSDATRTCRLDQMLTEQVSERPIPRGLVSVLDLDEPPPATDAAPHIPHAGLRLPWAARLAAACLAIVVAVGAVRTAEQAGVGDEVRTPRATATAVPASLENRALAMVSTGRIGDSLLAREARSIVRDAGHVLREVQSRLPRRPRPRSSLE
jgi:hypothetical protein